ncbi:MAG: sulfatase, partial [Vicinamibacteria bacterium]|nr:sulfatase [Vicinamibacteria bacterium]
VAALTPEDGPRLYLIPLPARMQKVGENRMQFVSADERPVKGLRRQWAGRMHSCVLWGANEAPLDMDPLARQVDGDEARIIQISESRLSYAFRLPSRAELRFSVGAKPAARASSGDVELRVLLARPDGTERDLWSMPLSRAAKAASEVVLDMPGRTGEVVQLSLCVDQGESGMAGSVSWINPRVLGTSAPPEATWGFTRAAEKSSPAWSTPNDINVMLIVLDAARADHIGCYGYERATTPEIDRIASESVVFDRAYTPAVYTLGAMSALWTSQYPDRFHAGESFTAGLSSDRITLPEQLEARGIRTVGITANAMAGSDKGLDRGFSRFSEILGDDQEPSRAEDMTRAWERWLTERGNDRFFAYLHFREPHFPYDPPAPFNTRFGPDAPLGAAERKEPHWYKRVNHGEIKPTADQIAHLVRLYDGNLAYADAEVGKIRQALERHGLWDSTALILIADHGEQLLDSGHIGHNAQVREESARIPLIMRIPGLKGGSRVRALVDLLDVAPTIAELFGLSTGSVGDSFEGRSLLSVIDGAPGKPAVLTRTVWSQPVYGLQDHYGKFVYDSRSGRGELYDLEEDPHERRNLCAARPILCAYYRQSLLAWLFRLKPAGETDSADSQALTRERCLNLKFLGYHDGECP